MEKDESTALKRVVFTPETFIRQRWGGVSHSFVRIAQGLSQLEWNTTVFAGFYGNRHLADGTGFHCIGKKVDLNKNLPRMLRPLSRLWFKYSIQTTEPCIIHDTYYWSRYSDNFPSCPYVVTVHDMIGELFPAESRWSDHKRLLFRQAVDSAEAIVVPSHSTASDLIRLWQIDPARIFIAPHGVLRLKPAQWSPPEWPYVLYVGGRKGYKDFATARDTVSAMRSKGWDGGIVCFGKPLKKSELQELAQAGIPSGRTISESGSDHKLAAIYSSATALLYTSLYEGFGMPILEAMIYGCPVICSDTPACVEAAGEAALIAKAGDTDAFLAHLSRLISDQGFRETVRANGIARAESQTWNQSACSHAKAYKAAWQNFIKAAPQVIIPNLNHRFSGITSTVARVLPHQAKELNIVSAGYPLPCDVPHLTWKQIIRLTAMPLPNGKPRIFHARRNNEMLAGLILKHMLRRKLHLIFTSTAQRHHSSWTRFLYQKMDTLLSTSPRAASYLNRKPAAIIPHGVDLNIYHPADDRSAAWQDGGLPGHYGIGIFGRIRPQKGLAEFITALCKVLPHHPEFTAVIIGETTPKFHSFGQQLKRDIAAHGLQDRFCWLGKLPFSGIPAWFRRMSLVACVPHNEGFGLTCLEAMASAVPVIATRTGAFEMIVREGIDGSLVPCADADALEQAFSSLLTQGPARLEQMGHAARSHICASFSIEQEAHALNKVYRSILSPGQ